MALASLREQTVVAIAKEVIITSADETLKPGPFIGLY
jgi:hypothetical protein